MSKKSFSGFTIIETMLFLAVTAMLVVGILAGTGASISNQRYSDSVYSLQAYFQKQLSEVVNISNDSSVNGAQSFSCDSNAIVSKSTGGRRGQSDCIILGKLITTKKSSSTSGANQLISRIVVAYPPAIAPASSDDTIVLKSYTIRAIQDGVANGDIYDIEWGGSLMAPSVSGAVGDSNFSILTIKSPVSGIIRTYIAPSSVVSETSLLNLTMVQPIYLQNAVTMCINSDNMFKGERMAVKLDQGAASASSVEIFSSTALKGLPGPTKVHCDR